MKRHRKPSTSQGERPRTDPPFRAFQKKPTLADTLILDIEPPELWKNTFLLFKPLSLWCFVTTVSKQINYFQYFKNINQILFFSKVRLKLKTKTTTTKTLNVIVWGGITFIGWSNRTFTWCSGVLYSVKKWMHYYILQFNLFDKNISRYRVHEENDTWFWAMISENHIFTWFWKERNRKTSQNIHVVLLFAT